MTPSPVSLASEAQERPLRVTTGETLASMQPQNHHRRLTHTSSSEAHSLKTLLETPRHVIPQEVRAERREQQIDRLHDLGGVSVFFDCAAEEGKQLSELMGIRITGRVLKKLPHGSGLSL